MSKELVVFGCSMPSNYVRHRNQISKLHMKNYGRPWVVGYWDPIEKKAKTRNWEYIEEFSTFDVQMSNYFNLRPKNYAYPGSGNLSIFNKASDYINLNHEKIGLMVVCWTQLSRIDFLVEKNSNFDDGEYLSTEIGQRQYQNVVFFNYEFKEDSKAWKMYRNHCDDSFSIIQRLSELNCLSVEHDVDNLLKYIYMIQSLCETFGVPLIQCTSIIDRPNTERIKAAFITNKTFHSIDREQFYGYPLNDLDGTDFLCNEFAPEFCLNEFDKHPSALQHEKMAEKLIDFSISKGIM